MINGVTSTQSAASSADTKGLSQSFDQFLLLLTTQLKNQDPLAPMDSTEFTNQLVSFSQVEQQIKTNDNLTKLLNLTNATQTTLGLSYIGLNVDVHGDQFEYFGTGGTTMSYTLPAQAQVSQISIIDQNGNSVYSQPGELSKGTHPFVWNGLDSNGQQVPAGMYQMRVGALDTQQKSMDAEIVVPGLVSGITTDGSGGVNLIVGKTHPQTVPLSSVTQASM
jgi:flagellar basal-body rod modification protein FlgD